MGKGLVGLGEQKGADRDLRNRVKYEKVVANQVDNPAHVEERSEAHDENMQSFASMSTIPPTWFSFEGIEASILSC